MICSLVCFMVIGLELPTDVSTTCNRTCDRTVVEEYEWRQLPDLPDREGFASGFAGVTGGHLVFAGGANFPDKRPWEGGRKVWYDTVYVLDSFNGQWRSAGKLRHPLAYGVSVTWNDSVICVGGSDENQHYREVFCMKFDGEQIQISDLPSLPFPIANASGALVGDRLFVIGGQKSPQSAVAEQTLFMLNLADTDDGWQRLPDIPATGRILSVSAASESELFVMSGAELSSDQEGRPVRRYLKDAWKFGVEQGWVELPGLSQPVVAGPSPSFFSGNGPLIVGGDDGQQVSTPPAEHIGFSHQIICFNSGQNTWYSTGRAPTARVTASTAQWNGWNIILSGESRPGIRSPHVWAFRCVDNSLPCEP